MYGGLFKVVVWETSWEKSSTTRGVRAWVLRVSNPSFRFISFRNTSSTQLRRVASIIWKGECGDCGGEDDKNLGSLDNPNMFLWWCWFALSTINKSYLKIKLFNKPKAGLGWGKVSTVQPPTTTFHLVLFLLNHDTSVRTRGFSAPAHTII